MEAMWINFESKNGKKFAIRPFLGGINGISGEASTGNMASLLRQINSLTPKQDYVVLPDQRWLDGIATSPGMVKQFVATKMVPPSQEANKKSKGKAKSDGNGPYVPENGDDEDSQIGATVEWQVTGQDAVGGVQLQIIPSFDVDSMHACSIKDTGATFITYLESYRIPSSARNFDVLKTPKEEGLQVGDVIHVKDMKTKRETRQKVVGDLLAEAPITLTIQDVVELEIYYRKARELIFNVHHPGALEPVISLKVYSFIKPGNYNSANQSTMQFEDDDEFDGIIAVIRDKLQGLSGVLHVSGVVKNAPDYLLPVQNWGDFNYFRNILDPPSEDRRINFVWVSVLSLYGCRGYWLAIGINCMN
jgi:hypothetical protein